MPLVRLRGQRPGHYVYQHGDFLYHKDPHNSKRFLCSLRTAHSHCLCVLKKTKDGIQVDEARHNHTPPQTLQRRQFIKDLKTAASSSNRRASDIINNVYR